MLGHDTLSNQMSSFSGLMLTPPVGLDRKLVLRQPLVEIGFHWSADVRLDALSGARSLEIQAFFALFYLRNLIGP